MDRRVIKDLTGRAWYHQRFDGSPFYLFFIGEAEVRQERRKPPGTEADVRVCFFEDGKADWYLDLSDVRRGSEAVIRLAKRDPNISKKLLARWQRDEMRFQDFFDRFAAIHLGGLSDTNLLKLYGTYAMAGINRFTSSSIIDHFALGTDEHIARMLREEVGALRSESQFTEIFSAATAPVHQSFINAAEMELLKIAIAKAKSLDALAAYQQRYFWISNNYRDANVLAVEHFKKEVDLWRTSKKDLTAQYRQLQHTARNNAKKKAALFRQYTFSPLLKTLLKISEDFTWWQDERKKATFLNIHLGTQILGEMARRIGLDRELTKFLVPGEVALWFRHGEPSVRDLTRRQVSSGFVCSRNGYTVAVGRDGDRLRRAMFPKKQADVVRDIRGLAASVGRVIGRVKVVGSVKEIGKVETGDILVAVMTRPDYIAGIKKAAALVTNEGGITCHAAIISRELGIPCIIGTKIATEVFHDGDLVEVNANHGVVTLLERV